jgi:hypothetical protein
MLAFRLIILLLLAYLIFFTISRFFFASRTNRLKRSEERSDQAQELVLCRHCQSYVPETEAVSSRGHYFCREECARLFVRTP